MSSYLISIHSSSDIYHGPRRAMLGDDEIFSSSVRALLHLSLQKRCHCQPDDARTRTSTNQLRRRYASTDPAIPWPPDATSLSWFPSHKFRSPSGLRGNTTATRSRETGGIPSRAAFSSATESAPPDSGRTVATVAFCFYLGIIVQSLTN